MDLNDWEKLERAKATKKVRRNSIDWIVGTARGEMGIVGAKSTLGKVKMIECTDGVLMAVVRGSSIHHYLAVTTVDGIEIRERGVEPWPRGRTRMLDALCASLDGELFGNDGPTRKFMDEYGVIASERQSREERAARPKRKRKKKKNRK